MIDPDSLTPTSIPSPSRRCCVARGSVPDPDDAHLKIPCYRVTMRQTTRRLHRDLPPTRLWTYGSSLPGPTIETRSRTRRARRVGERASAQHCSRSTTSCTARGRQARGRAVVHVHGARVPPHSDGYPEDWYVPARRALYHYPNRQDAATLWYHDHAMGINRLNIYAGLLSGIFIVRDAVEDRWPARRRVRHPAASSATACSIPQGQLYYPVSATCRSTVDPGALRRAILVNGKVLPHLDVEPRPIPLPGAERVERARSTISPCRTASASSRSAPIRGCCPRRSPLTDLVLAPAERADLVLDFVPQRGRADRAARTKR